MKTLNKLFLDELAEIYDSEVRLVWSIPKMVTAATCTHLQDAIQSHLKETESHVTRLQNVFLLFGERPRRKTSESIIALLNESHQVMSTFKGFPVINAALIAAVQKIENYEIASYGCLRDWAAVLGNHEAVEILQKILDENKATNQSLTDLARTRSNLEGLNEHLKEGAQLEQAEQEMGNAIARLETESLIHLAPFQPPERRQLIGDLMTANTRTDIAVSAQI